MRRKKEEGLGKETSLGTVGRTTLRAILLVALLSWTSAEAAQLQLGWTDNASNEDGYAVQRRLGAASPATYAQIAVLAPNATSYSDPGLTPGIQYCYRVYAFNAAGPSPFSNEACGTATTGPSEARIITTPGPGGGPHVQGFTSAGIPTLTSFMAYNPAFSGGLFVAVANLNGAATIITGAGPGGGPHVQAFNLSGFPTGISFMAYDPAFTGGVRVAACDVDHDGVPEIVTAAGPGGGPHVRVWKVNGTAVTLFAEFFAYAPSFSGGVFVACGDVDNDGFGEVITGTGAGGGPHVRVWRVGSGSVSELTGFMAYTPAFTGGVFVAAGDVAGDSHAAIITGAGAGGGPHVRVWSITANGAVAEVAGFLAYSPDFAGGVRVGVGNIDGSGKADIITGAGAGGGPHVRAFSLDSGLHEVASFFAYAPTFIGGVFVGGAP